MNTYLALAAVLVVAAPAVAEPRLLIEIQHRGSHSDDGPIRPINMEFLITNGNFRLAGITGAYTTADAGRKVHAASTALSDMLANAAMPGSQVVVGSSTRTGLFVEPLDAIWTAPDDDWIRFNRMVPRLGPGFTGYAISGISQTIDSLVWETAGGKVPRNSYTAQHTIRIFGETVPEPVSWLHVFAGLALICCRRGEFNPTR